MVPAKTDCKILTGQKPYSCFCIETFHLEGCPGQPPHHSETLGVSSAQVLTNPPRVTEAAVEGDALYLLSLVQQKHKG